MNAFEIAAIEKRARELRALEVQRIQGLFVQRLGVLIGLLGETAGVVVGAVSEALRPLFSWNPRDNEQHIAHGR